MNLDDFLEDCTQRCQQTLQQALIAARIQDPLLLEAMRYSSLNGGKRIRPALTYASCLAFGGSKPTADIPAAALELIHAYSLIHDDLPCMDDDDLRRGQPTCHRRFNEPVALLAGDSLQSLAFTLLAESSVPDDQLRPMLALLGKAALDMAAGQSRDLQAEEQRVSLSELEHIHRLKTGALMQASLCLGARAAGCNTATTLDPLHRLGGLLGLCFQIQDDILNVVGDEQTLGKRTGSDAELAKSTYPALLGLDAARTYGQQIRDEALQLIEDMKLQNSILSELSYFLVARDR